MARAVALRSMQAFQLRTWPRLLPHRWAGPFGRGSWLGLAGVRPFVTHRTSSLVYELAALDDRGRVANRVVIRALGWHARLCPAIAEIGGVLTVRWFQSLRPARRRGGPGARRLPRGSQRSG